MPQNQKTEAISKDDWEIMVKGIAMERRLK